MSSLIHHLFVLPPHLRCCHLATSSPQPHLWQRKILPTGTTSRIRLKLHRDRERHSCTDDHLSHTDQHLSIHEDTHTPFRSAKKTPIYTGTKAGFPSNTSPVKIIYETENHKFFSEDWRIYPACDSLDPQFRKYKIFTQHIQTASELFSFSRTTGNSDSYIPV